MTDEDFHSERLVDAFDYAAVCHATQRRKGTEIPYLSHLMGVASLLIEATDGRLSNVELEDLVIAGLLHDAVEDQGGPDRLKDVRARFGERVADIVEACGDAAPAEGEDKPPWSERKRTYLEHLVETDDVGALLVSAADKVHNSRAILTDLRVFEELKTHQKDFWMRFIRDKDDAAYPDRINEILWYYSELARILRCRSDKTDSPPLARLSLELCATVKDILTIAKSDDLKPVEPPPDLKAA